MGGWPGGSNQAFVSHLRLRTQSRSAESVFSSTISDAPRAPAVFHDGGRAGDCWGKEKALRLLERSPEALQFRSELPTTEGLQVIPVGWRARGQHQRKQPRPPCCGHLLMFHDLQGVQGMHRGA